MSTQRGGNQRADRSRGQRIGRKTGPKPRFTADDAVDAALAIGVNTFTLGQVATRLGITTPALYRVIKGRDALVELCLERWVAAVEVDGKGRSWQDQLRAFADSIWEANVRFPGMAVAQMQHADLLLDRLEGPMAELSRSLAEAGLEGGPERIAFAADFVADTVQASFLGTQVFTGSAGAEVPTGDPGGLVRGGEVVTRANADPEGRDMIRGYIDTARGGEDTARGGEAEGASAGHGAGGSGPDDPPEVDWTFKAWLDRKVEFIIAGLERGL